uniref:Putative secreted protein n=1 Tax=Ixodes ricinus TaxID=34613 RepID=A0A6B0UXX9_IXORI
MLRLLLEGLLELALLAVLVDPPALLGVAECRAGPAVGVDVHRTAVLDFLAVKLRQGAVDLVSRAHGGRRVVALVLHGGPVVGVGQLLVVRVRVSAVRVRQVLEVDVGAVGVVLALVGRPPVHQGVPLQAGFMARHREHSVLLDLLQLLLVVFLVVVETLLAVLVGPV